MLATQQVNEQKSTQRLQLNKSTNKNQLNVCNCPNHPNSPYPTTTTAFGGVKMIDHLPGSADHDIYPVINLGLGNKVTAVPVPKPARSLDKQIYFEKIRALVGGYARRKSRGSSP